MLREELKVLFIRKKIKMKDFAKDIGITPQRLSNIVHGGPLNNDLMSKIAEGLNVKPSKIFGKEYIEK